MKDLPIEETEALLNYIVETLDVSIDSVCRRITGFTEIQSALRIGNPIEPEQYQNIEEQINAFVEDADTLLSRVSKIQSSYQRLKGHFYVEPKPQNNEKSKKVHKVKHS